MHGTSALCSPGVIACTHNFANILQTRKGFTKWQMTKFSHISGKLFVWWYLFDNNVQTKSRPSCWQSTAYIYSWVAIRAQIYRTKLGAIVLLAPDVLRKKHSIYFLSMTVNVKNGLSLVRQTVFSFESEISSFWSTCKSSRRTCPERFLHKRTTN